MQPTAFNFEVKRKAFHLYGIILPVLYLFLSKLFMVLLLFFITPCVLYLDISRHYNYKIKDITNKIFSRLMREKEASGSFVLSGASFMITGFFLTSLFFPKGLAITSWFILLICDSIASLVGIKIGAHKINNKSIEGSIAFLSSAIFISILCYFYIGYSSSFLNILISCLATTAVELYSEKINADDNLLIPVTYCISTSLLNLIM